MKRWPRAMIRSVKKIFGTSRSQSTGSKPNEASSHTTNTCSLVQRIIAMSCYLTRRGAMSMINSTCSVAWNRLHGVWRTLMMIIANKISWISKGRTAGSFRAQAPSLIPQPKWAAAGTRRAGPDVAPIAMNKHGKSKTKLHKSIQIKVSILACQTIRECPSKQRGDKWTKRCNKIWKKRSTITVSKCRLYCSKMTMRTS